MTIVFFLSLKVKPIGTHPGKPREKGGLKIDGFLMPNST